MTVDMIPNLDPFFGDVFFNVFAYEVNLPTDGYDLLNKVFQIEE
jgi:hypothetical protein